MFLTGKSLRTGITPTLPQMALQKKRNQILFGIQRMILQIGGPGKLEEMKASGELNRLRDMILADSRVQLVAVEYVDDAVK